MVPSGGGGTASTADKARAGGLLPRPAIVKPSRVRKRRYSPSVPVVVNLPALKTGRAKQKLRVLADGVVVSSWKLSRSPTAFVEAARREMLASDAAVPMDADEPRVPALDPSTEDALITSLLHVVSAAMAPSSRLLNYVRYALLAGLVCSRTVLAHTIRFSAGTGVSRRVQEGFAALLLEMLPWYDVMPGTGGKALDSEVDDLLAATRLLLEICPADTVDVLCGDDRVVALLRAAGRRNPSAWPSIDKLAARAQQSQPQANFAGLARLRLGLNTSLTPLADFMNAQREAALSPRMVAERRARARLSLSSSGGGEAPAATAKGVSGTTGGAPDAGAAGSAGSIVRPPSQQVPPHVARGLSRGVRVLSVGSNVLHLLRETVHPAAVAIFGTDIALALNQLWSGTEPPGGDVVLLLNIEASSRKLSASRSATAGLGARARAVESLIVHMGRVAAVPGASDEWLRSWGGLPRVARLLRDALPQAKVSLNTDTSCLIAATAVAGVVALALSSGLDPSPLPPTEAHGEGGGMSSAAGEDAKPPAVPSGASHPQGNGNGVVGNASGANVDGARAGKRAGPAGGGPPHVSPQELDEDVVELAEEVCAASIGFLEEAARSEEPPVWQNIGLWLLLLVCRIDGLARAGGCDQARAASVLRLWTTGGWGAPSFAGGSVRSGRVSSGWPAGRVIGVSGSGSTHPRSGGGRLGANGWDSMAAVASSAVLSVVDAADMDGDDATLHALCSEFVC